MTHYIILALATAIPQVVFFVIAFSRLTFFAFLGWVVDAREQERSGRLKSAHKSLNKKNELTPTKG